MDVRQVKREVVYRGRVFDLVIDQVVYPSGNPSVREIAHHPGGAVAVPITDDGHVIMVKQFRYPLGEYIVELPAGKLNPGEDPRVAAARELEEETGWIAEKLVKLTSIFTTPGFCDEVLHIYLATGLRPAPGGHKREEGELTMSLVTMPLVDAVALAERGDLRDGKTIVGLLLAHRSILSANAANAHRDDLG